MGALPDSTTIPTKVSDLTNDSGFITTSDIPTNVSDFNNDAGYLTSFTEIDPTVPSWAKQPNKPSYNYSEIGNTPDLSGFITKSVNDLTNYYLKSETYTKAEVAALIGAIQQFHYEIYATLPASGESNVLYLIGPTGSGSDRYEEYVYANNAFTKIGDTSIDLSGYVTTSALNTALNDYVLSSSITDVLRYSSQSLTDAQKLQARTNIGATAPEIFWATYGTTTATEIDNAVAAGKVVCIKLNGRIYVISLYSSSDTYVYFFSVQSYISYWIRILRSTNGWSTGSNILENTSNKVTSFQSTPDDTHYPSEKLVKDNLDAKMDAISVDTAPIQNSTNLITSGGVFNSLPFLPSTMEEFENPSNPMAKFIYNLAQTSQAFIFQDTNGKWNFINSFTFNSTNATKDYYDAIANAVNIISIGIWPNYALNTHIIKGTQPYVKYVNLVIGGNVTFLDNVFDSTSVERIVLSGGMNCTYLRTLFNSKPNIKSVDVRGLNTSKLQDIYRLFRITGMTSLDLSTWDTSKIYRADAAFEAGSSYFVDFVAPTNSKIKVSVHFSTQKNLSVESVEGIITWLYDYATNIPAAYDSSQTYANGDLVSHDNNGTTEYYINKTAITTAAAWDATKWQLVGSPSPTLIIHNTAKTAYNNVHGTDALATAVTAKGWILA